MPPLEESDHPRYHVHGARRANRPPSAVVPPALPAPGQTSGARPSQSSPRHASTPSFPERGQRRARAAVHHPAPSSASPVGGGERPPRAHPRRGVRIGRGQSRPVARHRTPEPRRPMRARRAGGRRDRYVDGDCPNDRDQRDDRNGGRERWTLMRSSGTAPVLPCEDPRSSTASGSLDQVGRHAACVPVLPPCSGRHQPRPRMRPSSPGTSPRELRVRARTMSQRRSAASS